MAALLPWMAMNNEFCIPTSANAERQLGGGWAATPLSLVTMFVTLVFFGLTYLADNAGGFNHEVYEPYLSHEEVMTNHPIIGDPLINLGRRLYEMNCAPCHQSSGMGSMAINVPPLAGSDWVSAENPDRIIRIVLNGLPGPVTVNGKQFDRGTMVPWRDTLSDEQIATILTFVRGKKEWGNNAPAVTPEQVRVVRAKTLDKAGPWNAVELLSMPLSH